MKRWQPFLRSPRSPPSPCSPKVCLMHAGTSCTRCLWRRSGGPLQTRCSATHLSRAASEDCRPLPPVPVRPLRPRRLSSSPACPSPQEPTPFRPTSRLQGSASLHRPVLPPLTSVCLVRTTHQQAQPGFVTERGQVDCVRPLESSKVLQHCCPRRETTRKHLAVSQATHCCP